MENKVLVFGHKNPDTDTICSSIVREILSHKDGWDSVEARRLGNINKETQYVLDYLGIKAPELLEKVEEGQQVLLVDHNEFNQSVEGIEKAEILGVTDHHRISNFETSNPLYYTAKPYGCTSTILQRWEKTNGMTAGMRDSIRIILFLMREIPTYLELFQRKQEISSGGSARISMKMRRQENLAGSLDSIIYI